MLSPTCPPDQACKPTRASSEPVPAGQCVLKDAAGLRPLPSFETPAFGRLLSTRRRFFPHLGSLRGESTAARRRGPPSHAPRCHPPPAFALPLGWETCMLAAT